MEQEWISIIVPVYKVEAYLDRCVESIVNQTYTNLEIILVDDGSPDNCPAMCDAWAEKDSRIRVIHKENGGLSDARNAGMATARGEYLAFVDSDDWVERDYIDAMYRALKDADADIAACDVRWVWEQDKNTIFGPEEISWRPVEVKTALTELVENRGFRQVAWNKLYKASVFAGEEYPRGRLHEDEFVTYRVLSKCTRLVYVDALLYNYYQRSGSIMQTFSLKRVVDAMDAYYERMLFFQDAGPEFYIWLKSEYCVKCASLYHSVLRERSEEGRAVKAHIKACRKKVAFSLKEWRRCSFKHQYYIAGTRLWIGGLCTILDFRIRAAKKKLRSDRAG